MKSANMNVLFNNFWLQKVSLIIMFGSHAGGCLVIEASDRKWEAADCSALGMGHPLAAHIISKKLMGISKIKKRPMSTGNKDQNNSFKPDPVPTSGKVQRVQSAPTSSVQSASIPIPSSIPKKVKPEEPVPTDTSSILEVQKVPNRKPGRVLAGTVFMMDDCDFNTKS
jgi:hypothetical protein